MVEMLVKQGADVNVQGGSHGTALPAASFGGHEKVVKMLVKQGADVNVQGGSTAGSVIRRRREGGRAAGADVNAEDGKYGTALQAASFGGHEKVVELLVKQGADVNAQGGSHGTAL